MKQSLFFALWIFPLWAFAQVEPVSENTTFKLVDVMPRFPGCEDEEMSDVAKKECADEKMLAFISKNVKYPQIARVNGIEGTCVVQFIVEKDGSLSDIRVVRDIGAGCGAESARVVKLMNTQNLKWISGMQDGIPVRVQFNLPFRFRFEGHETLRESSYKAARMRECFIDIPLGEKRLGACTQESINIFIYTSIKYPKNFSKKDKVELALTVTKNGEVKRVKVMNAKGTKTEKAVVRAVKKIPGLIPATIDKRQIESKYLLTVDFTNME